MLRAWKCNYQTLPERTSCSFGTRSAGWFCSSLIGSAQEEDLASGNLIREGNLFSLQQQARRLMNFVEVTRCQDVDFPSPAIDGIE